MKRSIIACLIATSALIPATAFAQTSEIEMLRDQVAAMQAQITLLNARLDELQQEPAAPAVTGHHVAPTTARNPERRTA